MLAGDVLEIGPGFQPFPVAEGARITYADRRIGGREALFPELAGQPAGPDPDVDLDLDVDGLDPFDADAFDVVIASHLIEHVADPVGVLGELFRVVRPGGRVVLVVPQRTATFDWIRQPTPAAHVLDEHARGVRVVSDDHIIEFCRAIWDQPTIHPEPVRSWHDPAELDDVRLELHRSRSIHVHCWTAEEFAALVATLIAAGTVSATLDRCWFPGDNGSPIYEFGLVLRRPEGPDDPESGLTAFIDAWCHAVLDDPARDPARLVDFELALHRDLGSGAAHAGRPGRVLAEGIGRLRADRVAALAQAEATRDELRRVLTSPSHRIGRFATTPARLMRIRLRDRG